MASININNFSVTIVSFPEVVGVDWTQDNPSVVLLITPDPGYTVTASNFSATTPLPSYVSSVTFSQDGANINCVVNYISPSVMPANDVLIDICASGYAEQTPVTLAGAIKACGTSNISFPKAGQLPANYSGSGEFNTTATVLTQSVIASTGYYFEVEPILALTIGNINNYSITSSKTYNSSNQLISIVFTVTYTFPVNNVTGDEFCLTANAIDIYSPPVEIQSWVFNTSNVNVGGATRTFTINGITGANWALVCTATPGNTNIVNTSGTIDSTGQALVNVIFPSTTINQTYTFVLTGNLSSTFNTPNGQSSTIVVNQYIDTSLSFGFTSTNSNVTVGVSDSNTFIPGNETFNQDFTYTVAATSTANFVISNPINVQNWTNQASVFPNYEFNVNSQAITIDNVPATKTLTAVLDVTIYGTGTPSLLSILDLDKHIQGALVPVQLSFGSTANAACCSVSSGTYFVASGQTFLTATSVLDASGNPAADGFYKQ